jgi:hippurate hydrolase
VGDARVNVEQLPVMGGEDFSFMLEERPGAFIFMGNGDTAGLHHEEYDFNDEAIPVGSSYWAKIIETAMPAS